MAYMTWLKEWNTGIDVIDRQHLRIVELINDLHRAGAHGHAGGTVVNEVVRELIHYTQTHFTFEEELQAQAGYPFAKAHKRLHELFIKKVQDYQARILAGEDVMQEVTAMLEQWLVNHIKVDDSDYAPQVRASLVSDEESVSGWLPGALNRLFKGKPA